MVTKVGNTTGPDDFSEPFSEDTGVTSGLTWGYTGGAVLKEGVLTTITDGSLLLSASSTNIIYIDYAGTPALATRTIGNKPSQTNSVFLWVITTGPGSITDRLDLRNWTTSKINT
jgi:hypothetical protein